MSSSHEPTPPPQEPSSEALNLAYRIAMRFGISLPDGDPTTQEIEAARLIDAWGEKQRMEGVKAVIHMRCTKHFKVPIYNRDNEGSECAACAVEAIQKLLDTEKEYAAEGWRNQARQFEASKMLGVERDRWTKVAGEWRAEAEMVGAAYHKECENSKVLWSELDVAKQRAEAAEARAEKAEQGKQRWRDSWEAMSDRASRLERELADALVREERLLGLLRAEHKGDWGEDCAVPCEVCTILAAPRA